ncbi:lipoprotein bor, partial [Escherichia coli]|nr:lipoprotein bor [Escherichia coli]
FGIYTPLEARVYCSQ